MSLQDQHLQQALKNAPDRDVVPSDAARAAVLAYANKALSANQATWRTRISEWMDDWFGSNWQPVGLGSAVATLLIVVVVWHGQPDGVIWQVSKPIEEAAIKSVDSIAESPPQAASAKKESRAVADTTALAPAQKPSMQMAERQVRVAPSKAKAVAASTSPNVSANTEQFSLKDGNLAKAAPQAAPAETQAELPMAAAPAPMAREESADAQSAKGELVKTDNVAKKSVAKVEALGASLPKPIAINGFGILMRIKNEGGKAAANQDIQAGHFRLIKVEALTKDSVTLNCPEIPTKLITLDAFTGYQVETVGTCDDLTLLQSEAEAYNQTMRDWQSSHLK